LPKIEQANKVVYQKPKEKRDRRKKTVYRRKKVKILREVLEDGKSVSQTAENYGVHPNLIPNWRRKQSSRNSFSKVCRRHSRWRPDIAGEAAERKDQTLEEKLREKEVIAELTQEVLALKKTPMAGYRQAKACKLS
jgi:transposase-like protein